MTADGLAGQQEARADARVGGRVAVEAPSGRVAVEPPSGRDALEAPSRVAATAELPADLILSLCDRLIGEVGRRRHLFSWLRAPGGGADSWLPIDAYYPGHRLVVLCRSEEAPEDPLVDDLVPKHGLRLLRISPAQLGTDVPVVELRLARMVDALTPPPLRREGEGTGGGEGVLARAVGSMSRAGRSRGAADGSSSRPAGIEGSGPARADGSRAARADGSQAARADGSRASGADSSRAATATPSRASFASPSRAPAAAVVAAVGPRAAYAGPRSLVAARPARAAVPAKPEAVAAGVVAGMLLAAICLLEVYLGVFKVAIARGHVVLGIGIATDACARAIGTIAASRTRRRGWAWACAIVGSPAVAAASFQRAPKGVHDDALTLARLLSVLALIAVAAGLLA